VQMIASGILPLLWNQSYWTLATGALDCFAIVSRAIPNAASIEVSRASAMWRAIQINSQQPRQKNLLLGTVPGGDGISVLPQTQHFKTGVSDSKAIPGEVRIIHPPS
jgi:hypothetical protein